MFCDRVENSVTMIHPFQTTSKTFFGRFQNVQRQNHVQTGLRRARFQDDGREMVDVVWVPCSVDSRRDNVHPLCIHDDHGECPGDGRNALME